MTLLFCWATPHARPLSIVIFHNRQKGNLLHMYNVQVYIVIWHEKVTTNVRSTLEVWPKIKTPHGLNVGLFVNFKQLIQMKMKIFPFEKVSYDFDILKILSLSNEPFFLVSTLS